MPFSWMAATHRWLGMGEMPKAPVVEYLARSVSAFYALFGALCLVLASDLDRYRPLVRVLGVAFALLGPVFLWVDLAAGMPWWWAAAEGPPGVVVGAVLFWLARPGRREGRPRMSRVRSPNADTADLTGGRSETTIDKSGLVQNGPGEGYTSGGRAATQAIALKEVSCPLPPA
jgi:hypothetical protein